VIDEHAARRDLDELPIEKWTMRRSSGLTSRKSRRYERTSATPGFASTAYANES
jgi:hypothetical protein